MNDVASNATIDLLLTHFAQFSFHEFVGLFCIYWCFPTLGLVKRRSKKVTGVEESSMWVGEIEFVFFNIISFFVVRKCFGMLRTFPLTITEISIHFNGLDSKS